MKTANYQDVRSQMAPGDIIAFSGKGAFSDLIKWATASTVSHVGIVFQSNVVLGGAAQPGVIVDVMESTTMNVDPVTGRRIAGVQRNRLSERIKYYDGQMWWLPLSAAARAKLNLVAFTDFLLHQVGRPYDLPQALQAGVDLFDGLGLGKNREDFSSFFCSELAAAALEAGGVIAGINSSEVTPIDLCSFSLYADDYVQLSGSPKTIKGFNTRVPDGFGR